MAVGLGIVLLVLGLILVSGAINVDLGGVEDLTLGWILVFVGIVAIVVSLLVARQRSTRTTQVERHVDR